MNDLLDAALQCAARGWPVLPLHSIRVVNGERVCTCWRGAKCKSAGKHPRPPKTGIQHALASTDPAQLEAWWRDWPDANVGVVTGQRSGLAVVDIDGPDGVATLKSAIKSPLQKTLSARSGRPGIGRHLYYAASGPVPSNDGHGLDIRGDGGLVVVPPSMHRSGQRYAWLNQTVPVPLPAELLHWFENRPGEPKSTQAPQQRLELGQPPEWAKDPACEAMTDLAASLDEPVPIEDVAAAIAVITNPDLGWKAWKAGIMAIWAATDGSEAGRALGHDFSAKSGKYTAADVDAEWAHLFRSPPTRTGFGRLVILAREVQPGWTPPSRTPRETVPEEFSPFDPPAAGEPVKEANGHHAAEAMPELDAAFKGATTPNNPLISLNDQFCVIGDMGGKCLVLGWVPSKVDAQLRVPSFQSFKSFAERYAHKYVKVADESKPIGAYWLKWPGRKSYEGIDLSPEGTIPAGYLNLWNGFAVEPKAGDWSRMREHIVNVLAAGDAEAAGYILRFAAWAVQHPGERAEVALVFRGDKGSGKGSFANALKRLFGQHGLQIFNSKHLVGAFNGHLRNCLLLFADEAFWAGDKQGESVLKGMLTEPALMIEQKGIDATPWRNRLHVIMAANADWVVPTSHDERRYAIFNVSAAKVGDRAYFRALHEELSGDGLAAMLFDLQRAKLGDWHPRQVIHNEALRLQKERSLSPIGTWWATLLQDATLPVNSTASGHVPAHVLLNLAREHSTRPGDVNVTALGRFLGEQSCEKLHKKDGNWWKIPELKECRDIWERSFGAWRWREKADVWKTRG